MEDADNLRPEQQGPAEIQRAAQKAGGISNTVLASSLRELEEKGLVRRKEYLEVPVRVEYSTTDICDRLMPILESLSDFGEEMMGQLGG